MNEIVPAGVTEMLQRARRAISEGNSYDWQDSLEELIDYIAGLYGLEEEQ